MRRVRSANGLLAGMQGDQNVPPEISLLKHVRILPGETMTL
jgi:hypothetical protein